MCEGYKEEELEELIGRYDVVFSDAPGHTKKVVMTIDTGESPPVRQAPYSVPVGLKEEVRSDLGKLEAGGIIERSDSVWASTLVPVRNKEGGLRLCVDFRKVNAATVKEPYYIPAFEEMLEMVGKGRVLSKVARPVQRLPSGGGSRGR